MLSCQSNSIVDVSRLVLLETMIYVGVTKSSGTTRSFKCVWKPDECCRWESLHSPANQKQHYCHFQEKPIPCWQCIISSRFQSMVLGQNAGYARIQRWTQAVVDWLAELWCSLPEELSSDTVPAWQEYYEAWKSHQARLVQRWRSYGSSPTTRGRHLAKRSFVVACTLCGMLRDKNSAGTSHGFQEAVSSEIHSLKLSKSFSQISQAFLTTPQIYARFISTLVSYLVPHNGISKH